MPYPHSCTGAGTGGRWYPSLQCWFARAFRWCVRVCGPAPLGRCGPCLPFDAATPWLAASLFFLSAKVSRSLVGTDLPLALSTSWSEVGVAAQTFPGWPRDCAWSLCWTNAPRRQGGWTHMSVVVGRLWSHSHASVGSRCKFLRSPQRCLLPRGFSSQGASGCPFKDGW